MNRALTYGLQDEFTIQAEPHEHSTLIESALARGRGHAKRVNWSREFVREDPINATLGLDATLTFEFRRHHDHLKMRFTFRPGANVARVQM